MGFIEKYLLIIWGGDNGIPCVLSLAGYVLGVTMMVIIIGIGAGIVLGYTYKRSVASLLGSLREERKVHKVKADSFVAFLPIKEVRCWKRKTSSRCRDLVLVFTR